MRIDTRLSPSFFIGARGEPGNEATKDKDKKTKSTWHKKWRVPVLIGVPIIMGEATAPLAPPIPTPLTEGGRVQRILVLMVYVKGLIQKTHTAENYT